MKCWKFASVKEGMEELMLWRKVIK